MRIKKMTASFGKLKNSTLELGPGMNVISAPNEYGKSTWCAFIKAMLYGIDTSERDRVGYLSAKTRYKPWDGTPMAGTMELSHGIRDITIQRTSAGSIPFRNLYAMYTGTADKVANLNSENVGEELCGVSERVFERTAYIRRPDIRVNQTADLEKRISSIIFSGDEQSSYSEADNELRAWQRKLKFNKSGTLPQLESELREAEARMGAITASADELNGLRANIQRYEGQIKHLKEDLDTHTRLEERARAREIFETEKKVRNAEKEVGRLRTAITKNGHRLTRQDITDMRDTASSIAPLRKVRSEAERALWQAEKELNDVVTKKNSSPLAGLSEEDALALSRSTAELEAKVARRKSRGIPRAIPIAFIVLAAVFALIFSGLLSPFGELLPLIAPYVVMNIYGLAASGVLFLIGILLLFLKPSGGADENRLNERLSDFGVNSADKLQSLVNSYTTLLRAEPPLTAARDAARQSYDSAAEAAQAAEDRAVSQLGRFMPEVKSGQEVINALAEADKTIDDLNKAEFDLSSTRSIYETLIAQYGGYPEEDDSYIPQPLRDREDTNAALERAKDQLSETTRAFDVLSGERKTHGDPAIVKAKIDELREKIQEGEAKYAALTVAIDTLYEVNSELTTRFSPMISKKAGEYFERLTDGAYEKLSFDRGFDAQVRPVGETAQHGVITLSDGTADEIYFSLRLAMCELILAGDEPCPIILDDALLCFDEDRLREALDILAAVSETRQVILFSCHSREAELLRGKDGVTVIEA